MKCPVINKVENREHINLEMEIKWFRRMISINSVLLRINPDPIAYDIGSIKIVILQ